MLASAGVAAPAHAATASPAKPAVKAAKTVQQLCPPATKDAFACQSMRRTDIAPSAKGLQLDTTPSGFGPSDLASAYNLPSNGGAGQTVAIVDAFDDPNVEADLAVYRAQYGLPACTTANGCFSKVDQRGGTDYPTPDANWAGEISLDVDMVSAIAPQAHIILVEADTNDPTNLGASVDEAVALGAKFVSNSYAGPEDPSETTALDAYFDHPGVAVVASSDDDGYGAAYPASSPYVTAVGGTSLVRDSSARGWSESVWNNSFGATGSGCSAYEPKPSFQTDSGCANRAEADVSADADPATGVATYDTYQYSGWGVSGGTSASSPMIASMYADAGTPAAGSNPVSYPYADQSAFNDVTSGSNGTCTPAYLCTAGPGYDGPTGIGTPNGLAAFTSGPRGVLKGTVTGSDGTPLAGAKVTIGTTSLTTLADGTFTTSLPPGTYTLSVADYGYATGTIDNVVVTDGGTTTENVTLAAVAHTTVSGTVTDGSGKGWPLYATVKVEGAPGAPVYTNPKTGAYSVQVPVNASYTLDVTSAYTGYQPVKQAVTVGTSAVAQNVSVPIDATGCTAPGYTLNHQGVYESFDGTGLPAGWSVDNAPGTVGGWSFDNEGQRGNITGGSGNFAIVDSDFLGFNNSQDTTLTSPVADLSGQSDPELSFDSLYYSYPGQAGNVDLSLDGGTTWTTLAQYADDDVDGNVTIPLPQAADHSQVRVRFHFTASWGLFWELDDVLIGGTSCDQTPGGLVVGQVSDANTAAGVPAVTVSENGSPAVTATTATTTDPALTGSFYWLFSPKTGAQSFTAAKTHYTSGSTTVTVPDSGVAEADFSLKAGRLAITQSSLSDTLAWGGTGSKNLTVKNTGSAPATLNLSEAAGGFSIQGVKQTGAALQHVSGTFSDGDAAVSLAKAKAAGKVKGAAPSSASGAAAGTAWQPIANFPTTIQDNIADYYQGKLYSGFGFDGTSDQSSLYAYDTAAGTWSQLASAPETREDPAHGFIGGKLYVTGGWGPTGNPDTNTEIYDPASNSWSAGPAWSGASAGGAGSAVLGSKLYVVGGCDAQECGSTNVSVLDTASGTWSTVASYPESTSWLTCGAIAASIYCAGGDSGTGAGSQHTYKYDPAANAWTQLANMPAGLWGSAGTVANGELLMQGGVINGALTNQGYAYDAGTDTWSALPNADAPAYRFAGAVGFYTVGGGEGTFTIPLNTASVLPGYDQGSTGDVPWFSESASTVTLAPGKSATVTVTFNAADPSIVQPGTYSASLQADSDTPYSIAPLAISLQVSPPKTWGKITGVIQYTDSTGKLVPISGATVQIDTWATSYTLHTTADGSYALWLDTRNNPLTIIAAKDGFQPKTATVKITKGNTVIESFTLLKG
jgi:N-acetylneuraminic acid mutarotase